VLAGAYTDLDIHPTKSWDRNAPLQPQSRAARISAFSRKAGPTPFARSIPKNRCTRFGITCGSARNATESRHRPRSDKSRFEAASARRRRRSSHTRTRGRQRPCAHVGKTSGWARSPQRSASQAVGQTIVATPPALPKTERSTHRIGDGTGRKRRPARIGQPALSGRALLVMGFGQMIDAANYSATETLRAGRRVEIRAQRSHDHEGMQAAKARSSSGSLYVASSPSGASFRRRRQAISSTSTSSTMSLWCRSPTTPASQRSLAGRRMSSSSRSRVRDRRRVSAPTRRRPIVILTQRSTRFVGGSAAVAARSSGMTP
jgi:hypothetical protein